MLLTAEVVRALGLPDVRWRPIRIGPVGSTAMALLGIAALVFPVAVADPIGSLTLWLSFILLPDPLTHRFGAPRLIGDWRAGPWGRPRALLAGGGICGAWGESGVR